MIRPTSPPPHQSREAKPFTRPSPRISDFSISASQLLSPPLPSLLHITVAELRKRLDIHPHFNLLKFHTASPKISFLAYPDFEKLPHPALAEAIIVDLITGFFVPSGNGSHHFRGVTKMVPLSYRLASPNAQTHFLLMVDPDTPSHSLPLPDPADISARKAIAAQPPARER